MQYTVFDQLKQRLLKRRQSKKILLATESSPEALSAVSAFVLGAISKSVATIMTYPAIRYLRSSNFLLVGFVMLACNTVSTSIR